MWLPSGANNGASRAAHADSNTQEKSKTKPAGTHKRAHNVQVVLRNQRSGMHPENPILRTGSVRMNTRRRNAH